MDRGQLEYDKRQGRPVVSLPGIPAASELPSGRGMTVSQD
jgi:hypothetical protein